MFVKRPIHGLMPGLVKGAVTSITEASCSRCGHLSVDGGSCVKEGLMGGEGTSNTLGIIVISLSIF
jgi:hypothetical protein